MSARAARPGLVRTSLQDSQMPAVGSAGPSSLPDPLGYNPDPKRWQGWAEFRGPGRSALRRGGSPDNSTLADSLVPAPFRSAAFSASAQARAPGGASLSPNFLKAVQPWLRGGYLDGSGRGDPVDNKHGTFVSGSFLPSLLDFTTSSPEFIGRPIDATRRPTPSEEVSFTLTPAFSGSSSSNPEEACKCCRYCLR